MTINPLSTGSSPITHGGVAHSDPAQASRTDAARPASTNAAQLLAALEQSLQSHGKQPIDDLPAPNVSTENIPETSKKLSSLSNSVGPDIYAMMALFQEIAQEMRSVARETRHAEAQAKVDASLAAADKIRDAANDRMVGAIVSGSMQIAGGVTQFAGGIKGSRSLASNADVLGAEGINTKGSAILAGIDKQGQKFQAGSATLGGGGQIIQGIMDDQAARDEAQKAMLDADAQVHASASEDAKDLMNQMMDVIRDVREKLGSIEQSRLETNRGIARNV